MINYFIFVAICASASLNLAFVVDGSTNMGQANFSSAMKFVIGVSHRLGLYTNMTCIYFVFGELNAFYSISELMSAEADLSANFPNENQITLGAILNRARETLLSAGSSRVNASNIVVAITSGKSTDDIEAPTINLKASNVTVFAMGVGEKYSLGQLNEMASELDEDHVFTADSWEEVNATFVSEVAKKIYQGGLSIQFTFISGKKGAECKKAFRNISKIEVRRGPDLG